MQVPADLIELRISPREKPDTVLPCRFIDGLQILSNDVLDNRKEPLGSQKMFRSQRDLDLLSGKGVAYSWRQGQVEIEPRPAPCQRSREEDQVFASII